MHRLDQGAHMLGRRELADAMTEVEDVGRAGGVGVGVGISHSNKTSKSKTEHGSIGVGVGVGQIPFVCIDGAKSGQKLVVGKDP